MNRLKEALDMFETSATMTEELLGSHHVELARVYMHIGHLLVNRQQYAASIEKLEQALEIVQRAEEEGEGDMWLTGEIYRRLGRSYAYEGRIAEALQALARALDLKHVCLGEEHTTIADTYLWIGKTHDACNNWTAAMRNFEEALAIYKKSGGERHFGVAKTYFAMAFAMLHEGKFRQEERNFERAAENFHNAIPLMEKALELYAAIFGEDHYHCDNIRFWLMDLKKHRSQIATGEF